MSERKVLNKYYPPDFDPSKIPRCKREKNRQFTIRLMAPFNMRCTTCGEYIYRGKKFNAKKEDVLGKLFLGIQIYRFYIKCTKCLAEITFLTDPENQDYAMENGAVRNFESVRLAAKQADQEAKQEKEDEANNPMKLLENRTRDSRREMDIIETLEDIKELNKKNIHYDPMEIIKKHELENEQVLKRQLQLEEEEIQSIMLKQKKLIYANCVEGGDSDSGSDVDEEEQSIVAKKLKIEPKPQASAEVTSKPQQVKKPSISLFIKKKDDTAQKPLTQTQPAATTACKSNSNTLSSLQTQSVNEAAQSVSQPVATATPKSSVHGLGSLLCAYDDDDESD